MRGRVVLGPPRSVGGPNYTYYFIEEHDPIMNICVQPKNERLQQDPLSTRGRNHQRTPRYDIIIILNSPYDIIAISNGISNIAIPYTVISTFLTANYIHEGKLCQNAFNLIKKSSVFHFTHHFYC